MKKLIHISFTIIAAAVLSACGEENPDLRLATQPTPKPEGEVSTLVTQSTFFPLVKAEKTLEQSESLSNDTTVFADLTRSGTQLGELSAKDFVLMENGKEVKDFKVSLEDSNAEQVVDIAFVVDVTRSMGPFIDTAKKRLINFVKQSRYGDKKYHTRMCISTFGDYTVRKCDVFYDNDPNDPTTEKQTEELLSNLAKLHAAKGGPNDPDPDNRDPGNDDKPENPMGAIIDVSKAPWRADAQRFVIMVTDAPFLYSPDNQGVIGTQAPTMLQVNDAIDASKIVIMAVTPHVAGYDSPFQEQPDIVAKSAGEHFLFDDIIKGRQSLDDILGRIMSRVSARYKFTYVVDENTNSNLDPSLPITQRNITLAFRNPETGVIETVSPASNFPNGRPKYTTQWTVTDKDMDPSDAEVSINEKPVASAEYTISGKTITFKTAPAPSAKILVKYFYKNAFANLRLEAISLSGQMKESNLKVTLNGKPARTGDYLIERDTFGNVSVTFKSTVADDAYYGIKAAGGLAVLVE